MPRYRVMTPDTQRVPGKAYGDFECTQECESPVCVRQLLERHAFTGCSVWRQHRKHWELIFDTGLHPGPNPAEYWQRVQAAQ